MLKFNIVLQFNPSVDVYKVGDDMLEFYFIATRKRLSMVVSSGIIVLVQEIDGVHSLNQICDKLEIEIRNDGLHEFLQYLLDRKILEDVKKKKEEMSVLPDKELERYDRQFSYFDAVSKDSPYTFQKKLENIRFLIFGCGAIGSGIAIQLARAGARHFILVDKDKITADNMERHYFFEEKYVGMNKADALSDYLKRIDSQVNCECCNTIIDYDTELDSYLKHADFVVNTLDEPYIGFTSLKIGRACYALKMPLYVAGGFDAHLMSTGELILPDETPCVDCYTTYFTDSLKDWKPSYNVSAITEEESSNSIFEVGGLASMSLFSTSYAVIVILNYLATGNARSTLGRGELLLDKLNIDYLNVPKNPDCHVCGKNK